MSTSSILYNYTQYMYNINTPTLRSTPFQTSIVPTHRPTFNMGVGDISFILIDIMDFSFHNTSHIHNHSSPYQARRAYFSTHNYKYTTQVRHSHFQFKLILPPPIPSPPTSTDPQNNYKHPSMQLQHSYTTPYFMLQSSDNGGGMAHVEPHGLTMFIKEIPIHSNYFLP